MNNITVIGIGRLGLGLALLFSNHGYNVCGVDIFPDYVKRLNLKNINFSEPGYNTLLAKTSNFIATTSLEQGINHSDLIFILVQTPNSGGDRFYDHSILSNLLLNINKLSPKNKDIIIGCTVMPKYINEIGNYLISDCENCYLSYNPEFVAQGDVVNGFRTSDIILLGTENENLIPKIEQLYSNIMVKSPKFCIMKPIEAEIVKISLNGFITTKISYANIISDLCETIGARKNIVLESIGNDSRIGNKYFKPGHSFGGPCFPRDTKALKMLLDQNNIQSDLIYSTSKFNDWHIDFQSNQLIEENKDLYIFENVCYKENTKIPMIDESAKLKIAKNLVQAGKKVIIYDYLDIIQEVKKEYGNIFEYKVKQDTVATITLADTKTENNDDNRLNIQKVYEYWNNRPCNIKHSNKEIGTKEYFEEVSERKYKVEPHILKFANFSQYKNKSVLEVGCGIGTAAQSFIENGAIYTGIDLSDKSVELTKQRLSVFGLKGDVLQGNIEEIYDLNGKQFDLIYSFGVLHHTPNTEKAIQNIYKMLKQGGEFKLMMYAKNSWKYFEIQEGLDQYEAQNGVPIAKTYTKEDIQVLLKDFNDINIWQTHIFPYKIESYKNYIYEKKDYFKNMPDELFECLEKNLGWHLCISCKK
jgi:UDPglucose 6-dehydrogenase